MTNRAWRLLSALPANRRIDVAVALLLMCLCAVADAASVATLAGLLSALTVGGGGAGHSALAFGSVIGLSGVLRAITAFATQRVGHLASRDLIKEAHRKWLDQPYVFHLQEHSARLLATPERIEQAIFGLFLPVLQSISALLSMIAIVAILLAIDAAAALFVFISLAGTFSLIGFGLHRQLSRSGGQANRAYEDRVRALQDSQGAIRDIILDGAQQAYGRRLGQAGDEVAQNGIVTSVANLVPRQLVETGAILAMLAVTLLWSDRDGGIIGAIPTLGALALAGQRLMPSAQILFQGWTASTMAQSMADEALSLTELPASVAEPASAVRFARSIELHSVSFAYPASSTAELQDISLTIRKGERLVIKGPSGAGKSTLADLLMGLLRPSCGSISVDGVEASAQRLQRMASHVPQSPYFADEPLLAAIAGSRPVDIAKMRQAIGFSGLSLLVDRLEGGLDTRLGEDGVRLSGGERQRLALARAIYRDAPLLVLDEATSAVDDETEQTILDGLDRLQEAGKTIVVIAHRGGMLSRGGIHVTLDHGRLVPTSVEGAPRLEHQD
ncbi:ATP-binding cassette domain-containing protein [Sphingomonas jaspsi]|uniref:ATP-binding cassette domain-containing protein n=1 Tax=Sphingomonas jaspsi TaxID=392409 RepID=UPI0004ADC626|nr:ABC transporter ATP-binding protein [Sphingomonas jaspsi]